MFIIHIVMYNTLRNFFRRVRIKKISSSSVKSLRILWRSEILPNQWQQTKFEDYQKYLRKYAQVYLPYTFLCFKKYSSAKASSRREISIYQTVNFIAVPLVQQTARRCEITGRKRSSKRTTVAELLLPADKRVVLLYYKRVSRRCIYRRAPTSRSSLSLAPWRATLLLLLTVVLSKRDENTTNVPVRGTILVVLCREEPRRLVNNFIR